jgi:hypothetical protein
MVVVGSGALFFILLLCYAFFGNQSWFAKLAVPATVGNAIFLIPAVSVIYLLGIVVANVSHLLFRSKEERLRCESLKEFDEHYQYAEIRNELYTSQEAKDLVGEFEFRRSKVRISRGWFVNCILIIVALIACLILGKMSGLATLIWISMVTALMGGTYVSWRTATETELVWLRSYAVQRKQTRKLEAGDK